MSAERKRKPYRRLGLRCPRDGKPLTCRRTLYENGTVIRLKRCESGCRRWYRSEEQITEELMASLTGAIKDLLGGHEDV